MERDNDEGKGKGNVLKVKHELGEVVEDVIESREEL